jgi:hypothetical protein
VFFAFGNGMLEWAEVGLLISCASLMPCTVGGWHYSNAVDIFNVTSGAWSAAALSSTRRFLGATSLPNLGIAIFAGGNRTCGHVDFRIFGVCVFCTLGNRMVEWAKINLQMVLHSVCKSHALHSGRTLQRGGHLQRDVWSLEHCSS